MKSKRKFYKTIYQIEVLSEEFMKSGITLEEINYAIIDGDCSGVLKQLRIETLNGLGAANALIAQGSDPEFFRLNEMGVDQE